LKLPSKPLHLRLSFCALLIACCLALPSLLAVSSGAAQQQQQPVQQTPAATANAQSVSTAASGTLKFPVTVTSAKGGFMIGLTKENFSVWEGKQEREINYFSSHESPASVAILIDASGSVKPRTLEFARYAAARFIEQSYEKNEYLVAEFSEGWRASSGWRQDTAAAIDALNSRPAKADTDKSQAKPKPRGQTALYDACAEALDEVVKRPNPRHVLLLITDGQDNQSRISFQQLSKKIKASDLLIYAISMTDTRDTNSLDVVSQAIVDELTAISGGRAYFPETKKELDVVTDRIILELRHQYFIGFTPSNAAPAGKWNKVKIKLTSPDESLKKLYLRTREGYFSPPATP
jgi:Ca-activated chloride channel family protein